MEYSAVMVDGVLTVKPNIIKDDKGNITIQVPALSTIAKTIQEQEDSIRNIQQI